MIAQIAAGLAEPLTELIDDVFTSDEERAKARERLRSAEMRHKLAEQAQRMQVMLEEARSDDPWTSRARPSFLYVVYAYILAAIPYGALFAFAPGPALSVTDGVQAWLAAIPNEMWWLFGSGYLGYTAARSADKRGWLKQFARKG